MDADESSPPTGPFAQSLPASNPLAADGAVAGAPSPCRPGSCSVEPIIQASLSGTVAVRIKAMIVSGDLAFGQHLTERRLSEQFGVSKTPIREALLTLATEGLIEIHPRRGTFVFSLSARDIDQVTEVRRILEKGALGSAMRHNAAGLVAALRGNMAECANIADGPDASEEYRRLDARFHALFFEFADNPYIVRAYGAVACKALAMRNRLTFPANFIRISLAQHDDIVRQLEEGHLGQAVTHLDYHIAASFTNRAKRLLAGPD